MLVFIFGTSGAVLASNGNSYDNSSGSSSGNESYSNTDYIWRTSVNRGGSLGSYIGNKSYNMTATSSTSNLRATVNVTAVPKRLRTTELNIRIRVNGTFTPRTILQAWLRASSSGNTTGTSTGTTNYLSLGAFDMTGNAATLNFRQLIPNISIYDRLIISEEPILNTNIAPSNSLISAMLPASLGEVAMRADLRSRYEVPANDSSARGSAIIVINPNSNTIRYEIRYRNLEARETGAHFHGFALRGNNAPIIYGLPLGTMKTGTISYDQGQEANILAGGRMYVNIHSERYPDGEIRGWLLY